MRGEGRVPILRGSFATNGCRDVQAEVRKSQTSSLCGHLPVSKFLPTNRFFHHRTIKMLVTDRDDLMLNDRKANGGKGGLRHQAGMGPQARFTCSAGFVFDHIEQPPEQPSALSVGPDEGKVDIAFGREAHKTDGACIVSRDGNDLPRQALRPLGSMPAHRNPSRAMRLVIFARPITHGVEHDIRKLIIVSLVCPAKDMGMMLITAES